jgi:hypothetical protein
MNHELLHLYRGGCRGALPPAPPPIWMEGPEKEGGELTEQAHTLSRSLRGPKNGVHVLPWSPWMTSTRNTR